MPKVTMPRKSTNIDMTAMCDVAFLLLTFFMLATKFKPDEPVMVKTPASISEIPIPDNDIMLITVDPGGRVFFSIDNKNMRGELIEKINEQKEVRENLLIEIKQFLNQPVDADNVVSKLNEYRDKVLILQNDLQQIFD